MLETHQHADVYNLMGFSLRKTGDYQAGLHVLSQGARFRPRAQGRAGISGRALRRNRPGR
jgi:hypothetical protein